jgi:hypothetical protein
MDSPPMTRPSEANGVVANKKICLPSHAVVKGMSCRRSTPPTHIELVSACSNEVVIVSRCPTPVASSIHRGVYGPLFFAVIATDEVIHRPRGHH